MPVAWLKPPGQVVDKSCRLFTNISLCLQYSQPGLAWMH